MTATSPIHQTPRRVALDDLAEPTFPADAQEVRAFLSSMAPASPLDVEALHAQAVADTGLDDFGPTDYRERMSVLVGALRDIEGLDGPGTVLLHGQLLQLLKNRLQLTDLLRRHPAIPEIDVAPPVVIAGLPRTGTTHLHNLLSATPTFRTLPYWESLEPVPPAAEVGFEPDPRLARSDQGLWLVNTLLPHFELMHEMTTDHVHEEIQLLANDFSTMLFETIGDVPAWRDHYLAHDQTPHYAHLRLQLQALQHLRGGRRWLLKSPQHLEQLPVLERIFPGLTVVVTHRDPVEVVVSMVTMIVYSARVQRSPVPVRRLAADWTDRLELMLAALVRDRDAIPAERSMDVRFDEFMADDVATAERVLSLAGEPVTSEVTAAMATYLDGHRRGHLGRIDYQPEALGIDVDDLRHRFAPYVERFLA